jgi:hypothetical protein
MDDCTLCSNKADPRTQLMTRDGDVYPLCDGCAPYRGEEADVAEKCRATGKPPMNVWRRFGYTEPTSEKGEGGEGR